MKYLKVYEEYEEPKAYIIHRITPKEARKFGVAMWDAVVEPSERDLSTIVENSRGAHGVFADGKIVGAFAFETVSFADATEITILLVDPEWRKRGVGRAAVDFVCKKSASAYVIAHPHTAESEAFFAKMGFVMDEEFDQNDPNTMYRQLK